MILKWKFLSNPSSKANYPILRYIITIGYPLFTVNVEIKIAIGRHMGRCSSVYITEACVGRLEKIYGIALIKDILTQLKARLAGLPCFAANKVVPIDYMVWEGLPDKQTYNETPCNHFSRKVTSYQCRDCRYKDNRVLRPTCVYNGNKKNLERCDFFTTEPYIMKPLSMWMYILGNMKIHSHVISCLNI